MRNSKLFENGLLNIKLAFVCDPTFTFLNRVYHSAFSLLCAQSVKQQRGPLKQKVEKNRRCIQDKEEHNTPDERVTE